MQQTFDYGSQVIHFELRQSYRKTLGITVLPNRSIIVRAPLHKTIVEIRSKLKKRASWIDKQLRYFAKLPSIAEEKQYVPGETHRYLGKQYRLKIHKDSKPLVVLKGGYLKVSTPKPKNKPHLKNLVNNWYLDKAKIKFNNYVHEWSAKLHHYKIQPTNLRIREMSTRWGSCSKAGTITLNLHLIKHSPLNIQYVIIHELCHLKHHNHDKAFYNLLTKIMPDWKKRKHRLDHAEY